MKEILFRNNQPALLSKLKALGGSDLLLYFPSNEPTGTVAYNRGSLGSAANGVYTNAELASIQAPKGGMAPYFNGTNATYNIKSAAFDAAYNAEEFTVGLWYKIYNIEDFTDGATRLLMNFSRNGYQDQIQLYKPSTNNTIRWYYIANSVADSVSSTSFADINWHFIALTVSQLADQMIAYMDGHAEGGIQTGLGRWNAGTFDNCLLMSGGGYCHGYIAHYFYMNKVLNGDQILSLV